MIAKLFKPHSNVQKNNNCVTAMNKHLCRLCGVERSEGLNLFGPEAIRTGLLSKIISQLPKEIIQIDASDNLTKFICHSCEMTVNHFAEFCDMVKKTQKTLTMNISTNTSFIDHVTSTVTTDCHTSASKLITLSVGCDGKIRCDVCLQYLEIVQLITLHMVAHGISSIMCSCRDCGHRDEVGNFLKGNTLLCPSCFFTTCGKPNAPAAIEDNKKSFTCEVCSKSFRSLGHKNRHKLIHDGLKPFLCETCGVGFNQKASLRTHLLSHSGTYPHQCEWCGQSFRHKISLKSHVINIHTVTTKDSSYVCDQCKKAFATADKLRRHYRGHTGDQPYVCTICNKAFSQTGNLKNHMKKHKTTDFSDIDTADQLLDTPAHKILNTIFDPPTILSDEKELISMGPQLHFTDEANALRKETVQDLFSNFDPHDCNIYSAIT